MNKIAIFYMIGQYNDRWIEDFYYDQMSYIQQIGLYDACEFIDVFVKGRNPLPQLGDKFNNVTYLGDLEEDRIHNKKQYRAYNHIQQRMWLFANANPDYKVLFFHSFGISHTDPSRKQYRYAWRKYMEKLVLGEWQDCLRLLTYYDCVGTDWLETAWYKEETVGIRAPHYQGFFWWANASYLKTLDPLFCYQPIELQQYLCEQWIGSGNPKAFNFYKSRGNPYLYEVNPPFDEIIAQTKQHLLDLKNN